MAKRRYAKTTSLLWKVWYLLRRRKSREEEPEEEPEEG